MRLAFKHLLFVFFLLAAIITKAQEKPFVKAYKTSETIVLDGIPDEEIWQRAQPAKDFHQYFPSDTSLSVGKTEIYIAFDDKNVYLLAKCFDDLEGPYQTSSLRRDYRGGGNDGLSILIDTYQDNTNAFIFGMNPYGVRREGLISNGGEGRDSYTLSWDNKWSGESKIYDNMWISEMAIPLKTLRFKDNTIAFNMNFYRIDTKYNERSTWTHIPRNNIIFNLAFMGEVEFEEPLIKPGGNIALIPYVSLSGYQDKLADTDAGEQEQDFNYGIGGDAKIAVSPALNLDLTINPDFSQVEVDRQVTNLTRFELFFPERRQFFLENGDLFASFGQRNSRPFFSRRIGIAKDTLTGSSVSQPILFGARLSGKVSKNLRVGVMSMQTGAVEKANQASLNYSVGVIQQKVFTRSNISAIFVNKEDFNFEKRVDSVFEYNRLAGLEYNLASASNIWTGKAYYHYSIDPDNPDSTFSYGSRLQYNIRNFTMSLDHQVIGNNFNAEVGFVPRTGFQRLNPRIAFQFYPSSKILNRHGPSLDSEFLWDSEGKQTDYQHKLGYAFAFMDQSNLDANVSQRYILLKEDFDPTRSDEGVPLPAGSSYTYNFFDMSFRSDQRKLVTVNINGTAGQFFNGNRLGLGGNVNYRFQPFGNVGLDLQYNSVKLPDPYSSADLILIGPRIDLTFTKKIYLTGLFQYNNQVDNFSTNIRFQWRYKPVSDLYLVYTDNYYATNFNTKNRSLVFKLTYWLNL